MLSLHTKRAHVIPYAATSLARLWQSQDKRQDAYDLLAPVYGWFTAGFDTADWQDAKALRDELS
jgi:predicted ATPase